jgi:hypothetical protein
MKYKNNIYDMIYKKIKDFLAKGKEEKEKNTKEKEELIISILDMAEGSEKETFKKKELEKLPIEELKELKKELENS